MSARLAYLRAIGLLVLIAAAHSASYPFSRILAVAAATLQMYWPLVAFEEEGLRPLGRRLFVQDGRRELVAAACTLLVTLPVWVGLTRLLVPWALGPLSWPTLSLASASAGLEMALLAAQEEWFWRGYVQASQRHRWQSIVVTSLLFGGCHWAFTGSPLALATAIPSLIFGALARRRGRLLACTSVHIGFNLASRLLLRGS